MDVEETTIGMSAGEDPWSGPGKMRLAVATMLRNVVAAAAAGEDPWSGPGEESGMGRRTVEITAASAR